jgi:hypothetical protein
MSNNNWLLAQKLYIRKLQENNVESRTVRSMDVSTEGQSKGVGKGDQGANIRTKERRNKSK